MFMKDNTFPIFLPLIFITPNIQYIFTKAYKLSHHPKYLNFFYLSKFIQKFSDHEHVDKLIEELKLRKYFYRRAEKKI